MNQVFRIITSTKKDGYKELLKQVFTNHNKYDRGRLEITGIGQEIDPFYFFTSLAIQSKNAGLPPVVGILRIQGHS